MSDDETRARTQHDSLSEHALKRGHQLKSFVIQSELGVGGFGITYLARHYYLPDQFAAIKEYFPAGAATRDADSRLRVVSRVKDDVYRWGLQRFLEEARFLCKFEHPNIVRVRDYFEENDTAYMVMDYVDGRSLRQRVDHEGCLNDDQLRALLHPMLEALELVHEQGVLHRDITPSNVLMQSEHDIPVLIDFGSARYAMRSREFTEKQQGSGQELTALYTPGYSPIEQYEQTTQGPWTDIYGLGATLYHAAFGTRPPDALQRSGEMRTLQTDPLQTAASSGAGRFSLELMNAIDLALAINAEDRPQSVRQWRDMLGDPGTTPSITTSTAPPAPTATAPLKQRAKSAHNRGWFYSIAFGTLAVLVTIAVIAFSTWENNSVPALVATANETLVAAPLDPQNIEEATRLYLLARSKAPEDEEALRGESASNMLKSFLQALDDDKPQVAERELEGLRTLLTGTSLEAGVLEGTASALALRRSILSVGEALVAQPFSQETWKKARSVLSEANAQTSEPMRTKAGLNALEALEAANTHATGATRRQDFAAARGKVSEAMTALAELGLLSAEPRVAYEHIDRAAAKWGVERKAKIDSNLTQAESALLTEPLDLASLERAGTLYGETRALDANNEIAVQGARAVDALKSWLQELTDGKLTQAKGSLANATPALRAANVDVRIVQRAQALMVQAQDDAQHRAQQTRIDAWMKQLRDLLASAELSSEALENADRLTVNILAERTTHQEALAARSAIDSIRVVRSNIKAKQFERAVAGVETLRADLAKLGLDKTRSDALTADIARAERAAEKAANLQLATGKVSQAFALIESDPLAENKLSEAHKLYTEAEKLAPGKTSANTGLTFVGILKQTALALKKKQFDTAFARLNDGAEQAKALNFPDAALTDARMTIETAKSNHAHITQTRRFDDAVARLKNEPFNEPAWVQAKAAIDSLSSTDDPRRQPVLDALDALTQAKTLITKEQFLQAEQQVARAETALETVGVRKGALNRARDEVRAAQESSAQEIADKIASFLDEAKRALEAETLTEASLMAAGKAYANALKLDGTHLQAKAGSESVKALTAWLRALQDGALIEANAALERAKALHHNTDHSTRVYLNSSVRQAQAESTANAARLREQVENLLTKAAATLSTTPLTSEALREAQELYESVLQLEQDEARATAGHQAVATITRIEQHIELAEYQSADDELTRLDKFLETAKLPLTITNSLETKTESARTQTEQRKTEEQITVLLTSAQEAIADSPLAPQSRQTLKEVFIQLGQLREVDARAEAGKALVDALDNAADANSKGDLDNALKHLQTAKTVLRAATIAETALDASMQSIENKQRTKAERESVQQLADVAKAWAQTPFSEQTIRKAQEDIEALRSVHYRTIGLEITSGFEQAKKQLELDKPAQARMMLDDLKAPLAAIGLSEKTVLQKAFAEVDAAEQEFTARTEADFQALASQAQEAMTQKPQAVANLAEAARIYQRALELRPEDDTMRNGKFVAENLANALSAIEQGEFATAPSLLQSIFEHITGLGSTPNVKRPHLEAFVDAYAVIKEQLESARPPPSDAEPLITEALNLAETAPLDLDSLEAALAMVIGALEIQDQNPRALAAQKMLEALTKASKHNNAGRHEEAAKAINDAEDHATPNDAIIKGARKQLKRR